MMFIYDLIQILNAANNKQTIDFKFGSIPTKQTEEVYIPPVLILTNRRKDLEFTITIQLQDSFRATWVYYSFESGAEWENIYTKTDDLIRAINELK